ncbi:MAG: c-type cytochrome biogenesis protein CcmI, partial [Pseudomonadota bacterium]|nr:c-type cytochrome biogenesis protein CcmI [Pseudomonadota bacterium]
MARCQKSTCHHVRRPLPHGVRKRVRAQNFTQSLVILKDQLSEIDTDQERNLISVTEADAARVEIKRRILAAGR